MADLIRYAFVGGEISPKLLSRSDLEKFDLAVALATNWFVDYSGGLSTRPGQKFVDLVKNDDKETKFFPFAFGPDVAQTYVILVGSDYIRFIQDGAYVLEAAKNITNIASNFKVTVTAHGYSTGDWVKVFNLSELEQNNFRTFQVFVVDANNFELRNANTNAQIITPAIGPATGTVQRIYTIASPYAQEDLELLRGHQSRSVIYFTHKDYKTRILTRVAHLNWTLTTVTYGNKLTRPTISSVDAGAGSAGVGFQVTAVDIDGKESLPSDYKFDKTAVDYSSTAGQAKVVWNNIAGAVLYRVYRTNIIQTGADASRAMQVGFVGYAYGTEFVDNNIIPDFAVTPPTHIDPFADGSIEFIDVTAGGTGYTDASVVSITTSTGSGFVGYPVVSSGGVLLAIVIINGGSGYVAGDAVNVSVGTGATFTKTLTPASGNNPRVSGLFQQRKVYAGSDNDPITVWASQPGEYEVMDVATIVQEDDAYEFELDAEQVAPIEHLLSTRSGLVILSQTGIWQLTGGQGVAVTPTNALADPQSYTGCSNLPPLAVDTDILYVEGKGSTVRLLSYNDFTKVFAGQDLSILSNHLTKPATPVKAWTYASDPFKIVHGVRSDGIMVELTLVKEQNVYGWAKSSTKGLYKDVISIQEDRVDVVYVMVQRFINGRWTKMIEQVSRRDFKHVEDAWCVDAGLAVAHTYPAAGLSASAASGAGVTFTADAAVFASGDVGKILRVGGGKAVITSFTDTTHVVGDFTRDITDVIPEDELNRPLRAFQGEWTLDTPVTLVQGLWHLEGEKVKILADGSVLPDETVVNGTVVLDNAATAVIVGLGYKCIGQTLPPTAGETIIEGKRKRVVGMTARVYDTRGLKLGTKLTKLYPFKERTDEAYAEPTRVQEGMKAIIVQGEYDREGQVYFVQEDPLPATLLGFVMDLDVGDVDRRGK